MGIRGYANFFGQQGVSVFYLLVCLYSAEPKTERQMKMALYGSAIGAGEGSPVDQNYNWLLPVVHTLFYECSRPYKHGSKLPPERE